jgi:opacity protein-like surface antigen
VAAVPRPLFVLLAALLCCGFALAQSEDRIEVFGGYSYLNPDSSLVSPNHVNGWNGSVNFKARPWIGFVADFSGFYPSHTYSLPASLTASGKTYTFLFGPQVSLPRGRFAPFARFLIGASHVTPQDFGGISENLFKSNNALSLGAGGGLDYSLNRRIAIRGQAEWLYARLTPIGGGDPGANYVKNRSAARISTGIVFRF